MLRRYGNRPRFYAGLAAAIALSGMLMFLSCSKDNPVQTLDNTNSWTFTATVLDGYTGQAVQGAKVSYTTDKKIDTTFITSSQGRVRIEGLPPGAQTFKISIDSLHTVAFVNAEGVPDSTHSGATYLDVAKTAKLFPLKASISGKVVAQRNKLALKAPASGVLVSISYADSDMAIASPKAFQVQTDSTGSFSFTGLPVAEGCNILVANATIGGIDFKPGVIASPTLVPSISVPLGTIILTPINASMFKQMTAAPVVIAPNQSISVTYSDLLDSLSSATLEGLDGSQSIPVTSVVSGNKITVTPAISLVDANSYYLTIYAIGKAGGDSTSVTKITVQGGGLVDITASNVLDGNKKAINGLGLADSMVFTFRDSIVSGGATVLIGSTPVLVNVSTSGKTLVIKPKGIWQSGTYSVKVSANLKDQSTSTFNFIISTAGALDFIKSNVYDPKTGDGISGIGITDTIYFIVNKPVSDAQVTLKDNSAAAVPVSVTTDESGTHIAIVPLSPLKSATSYTISLTAMTAIGETKSIDPSTSFTTASSDFYPITDNVRFDNDPAKPVLNFSPNGVIFIKMSSAVQTATAQLTGGSPNPSVSVTWSADTIFVAPTNNLVENTLYNLKISASNKKGTVFNANGGNYVTGLIVKNSFIPVVSNVRYNNDPTQPVLDFPPYGAIVIKMSAAIQSATALLTKGASGTVVNCDVKVAADTIRIIPQAILDVAGKYWLSITANSTTGLTFNGPFVNGLCVQNKIRVIASNVLTADGLGITNFPVTGIPYFVISDPFDSTTIAISGIGVPYNLRTHGDTVFVDPVSNLAAATPYYVNIQGKTKTGNNFVIDNSASAQNFTTERDVYVVQTNTRDVAGNPAINFPLYGTMWVKFSEPLSTDRSKILWSASAAAIKLYGDTTKSTYNASVRIGGDTLFVTPLVSLVSIGYGAVVGFKVQVQTASGKIASAAIDFSATVTANGIYIVSANTKDAFGVTRTDFGLQDTVIAIFNTGIEKINAATFGGANLNGVATVNDLKLNATGDTMKMVPPIKLVNNTAYTVAITNVDLKSGLKNQTVTLNLGWTTTKGLRLVSANDMVNVGTYRPFSVTGDSLVISFSEAIDITKAYSIGGIAAWAHAQFAWSNGNKTVTIKGGLQDTLKAKAYDPNPDYTLSGTPDYGPITFTGFQASSGSATAVTLNSSTATDWVVTRPAINVHSVVGIELVNTNLKEDASKEGLYVNTFSKKVSDLVTASLVKNRDSLGLKDTIKLWFSRAVDSAKIFTAPSSYFVLRKNNLTTHVPEGAELNYTISLSTDKKTAFIVPVDSLKQSAPPSGQDYTLTMQNVPALGLSTALTGGKVPTYALVFTTLPTLPVMLTKETIATIIADTAAAAGIRLPYSPEIAKYSTIISSTANHVKFYFSEACWNANHNDSITGYEVAVKGYEGDWIELSNSVIATQTYDKWNPATVSRVLKVDLNLGAALDLAGVNVLSRLQKPAGVAGYSNAADIFNQGNVISVKIRPIYSANATFEYANDLYAASWSAALSFADNVAPCDSAFVATGNMSTPALGGVGVTKALSSWNRTAALTIDSTGYIELAFPEDMDITMAPTISFARGMAVATDYLAAATTFPASPSVALDGGTPSVGKTGWRNARTYRAYIKLPDAVDYNAGQAQAAAQPWTGFGMNVSVAGMKDASGVAIITCGAKGTSDASVNLANTVNGQKNGSASVVGWIR